jgi:hypothetical protein
LQVISQVISRTKRFSPSHEYRNAASPEDDAIGFPQNAFANVLRNSADVLVAVAFGYFVICFSLSQVGRHFERRSERELQPSRATARPAPAPALGIVDGRPKTQATP